MNKNKMEKIHELSFPALLDRRHREIMEFLSTYSDLTVVINSILMTAHTLAFDSTLVHGSKSMSRTYLGLMWQIAADYHKQSLVHILSRELDAGFALLRMATELARDAYVIGKNENRLDLWQNREKCAGKYRNAFKFDKTNPAGKYAFDLYKLASRYGVHGHMTSLLHANATGEKIADEEGVTINTNEKAIFSGLQIWLRGFFPIHALFCEAFHLNKSPVREPYKLFIKLVNSLDPILEAVDNQVGRKPKIAH